MYGDTYLTSCLTVGELDDLERCCERKGVSGCVDAIACSKLLLKNFTSQDNG